MVDELNPLEFANTAWASAKVMHRDEKLFTALARAAEQRLSEFKPQELANTAWALAKVSVPDERLGGGRREK